MQYLKVEYWNVEYFCILGVLFKHAIKVSNSEIDHLHAAT